jgi:hypothetical protein
LHNKNNNSKSPFDYKRTKFKISNTFNNTKHDEQRAVTPIKP